MAKALKFSSSLIAIVALLAGCNGVAQTADLPPATRMVVTVGGEAVDSPSGAALNIEFHEEGGEGVALLSWEAREGLSLVLQAPYPELGDGELVAEIVARPMSDESPEANLRIDGASAESGTVSLNLAAGRVTGDAPSVDLSFDGQVAISCWVPASRFPGAFVATPDDPAAPPPLVEDAELTSPECVRVKNDLNL